jgi:hypothetical protein
MARVGWLALALIPAIADADGPVDSVHASAATPDPVDDSTESHPMDPLATDHLMATEALGAHRWSLGRHARVYVRDDARTGDLMWRSWRATAGGTYNFGRIRLTTSVAYEDMQSWLGRGRMIDAGLTVDTTFRVAGHPFILGLTMGLHRGLGGPIGDPIAGSTGASVMLFLRTTL